MECIRCKSKQIIKAGFKKLAKSKVQRYKCQECKKNFTWVEKYHRLDDKKNVWRKR